MKYTPHDPHRTPRKPVVPANSTVADWLHTQFGRILLRGRRGPSSVADDALSRSDAPLSGGACRVSGSLAREETLGAGRRQANLARPRPRPAPAPPPSRPPRRRPRLAPPRRLPRRSLQG